MSVGNNLVGHTIDRLYVAVAAVHLFNGGTEESWAEKEQDERDSYGWLQEPVVRAVAALLLEAGAKQRQAEIEARIEAEVERLDAAASEANGQENWALGLHTSLKAAGTRAVLASITEEGK